MIVPFFFKCGDTVDVEVIKVPYRELELYESVLRYGQQIVLVAVGQEEFFAPAALRPLAVPLDGGETQPQFALLRVGADGKPAVFLLVDLLDGPFV